MDLPTADIVLLDDFRPDPAVIDIPTLLCWLEGGEFVISRPLNTYRTHLKYRAAQPHFATCNWHALYTPRGRLSETELSMLRARMKIYVFRARITTMKDIKPCAACFSMWVLSQGRDVRKFTEKGFPPISVTQNAVTTFEPSS